MGFNHTLIRPGELGRKMFLPASGIKKNKEVLCHAFLSSGTISCTASCDIPVAWLLLIKQTFNFLSNRSGWSIYMWPLRSTQLQLRESFWCFRDPKWTRIGSKRKIGWQLRIRKIPKMKIWISRLEFITKRDWTSRSIWRGKSPFLNVWKCRSIRTVKCQILLTLTCLNPN